MAFMMQCFTSLLRECGVVSTSLAELWIISLLAAYMLMLIFIKLQLNSRRSKQQHKLPPGPSPWPIVGNMLQANDLPHRWFAKLASQYGPILYLYMGSNPYVIVNNAEMAKEALKTRDADFASRPRSMFGEVISFGYEDMVFRSSDAKWRALRKLCASNLFTPTGMKTFTAVRQEEMLSMVSSVHSSAKGCSVINIKRVIYEANVNSMCRILFGKKYLRAVPQLDLEAKNFLDLLDRIVSESGQINLGDFIPALQWLDLQGAEKRLKNDMKQALEKFFYPVLAENRKLRDEQGGETIKEGEAKNFLDVLQSFEGEESFSDKSIAGILCNLILAGTDTTSVTVEWAFSELLANPHILRKAQEEIDSVVGYQRVVQESDLLNLPYLQAIVKETLRMHPALPLGIPHYNSATTHLGGYTIPAGSTLLVNIWAIAQDPASWSNPTQFNPDRFLGSDIQLVGQQFQLIPFSAGRRHCLGYPLVLVQVPHILATLLQAFDWSLPAGQRPEDINMQEKVGLSCYRAVPLELLVSERLPTINNTLNLYENMDHTQQYTEHKLSELSVQG
ncbi:hypothetical protein O6H91_10G036100 [Diphasiastrum complanatum]|uniref:Uncharacterized protein n=2 Tax=Diphasiastrum complanatum TaxID=34168 RepID=A0ACC2CFV0_DIPCM|nr:hypothetical protein O6H91_10G031800 [Diphasiastrum complanatum]KAJ7540913.1 hypothetical protein O6H91_10G036100 [Diphasiastrum complanatum]